MIKNKNENLYIIIIIEYISRRSLLINNDQQTQFIEKIDGTRK